MHILELEPHYLNALIGRYSLKKMLFISVQFKSQF